MTVGRIVAVFVAAFASAGAALAQTPSATRSPDGAALFTARCATCHASGDARTPAVDALRQFTAASIVEALTNGLMRPQGRTLSAAERQAIASYLSTAPAVTSAAAGACRNPAAFDRARAQAWNGWGPDTSNMRFQTGDRAGLSADSVPHLNLKWAFGFPGATSARAQPTVAGGRVFVGSQDGTVYALDQKTGCTIWSFTAASGVRTAIVVQVSGGDALAYFGDGRANVYALDAETGKARWRQRVDSHPSAHITGAPTLFEDALYVAVSSGEEGQGDNKDYACCTFRGSVVALDAASGGVRWKTFTIPDAPRDLGANRGGARRWGPSGAGIWSSPTIDPVRRRVYVATGNMYTELQQKTSDAVLAFDLADGRMAWASQVTPTDVFVVGCNSRTRANCGDDVGPDFDFGNSPMLVTPRGGKSVIVIGQKSGLAYALDPDKEGAVIWQYRAGEGSALGGMEFGSTSDGDVAYFPVADGTRSNAGELHAVRVSTGERVWMAPPSELACTPRGRGCSPALLAAISSIPGVIFAGSQDGALRAYSAKDAGFSGSTTPTATSRPSTPSRRGAPR